MNRVSSFVYRGALLSATLALVFAAGCKKKPPAAAPPPPPPPPPAAKPTVSLQANPTSINKGDSTTLSWTSTDATQLTIAPEVGAVTAQGSTRVTPSDSTTYTITASGPGGSADSSVRVTVSAPPPPPEKAPEPSIDELFLRDVKDAYFDYNKADIREDARQALGQTADFLKAHPEVKASIEGHCDERGSTEYNILLGDRRAAAVKNYLVQLGIAADRLTTVSYGKERPFCTEHDETCWQSNRRGHFVRVP
ncbi:MAG TPA: peptidoglycan-associated lipoprotein Pal [Candidatus Methylomirabilis sp.]|nr:peptidoglycan-associated lipoprotein Pal [Candidatus Methylomirabilis sp.]